VCTVLVWPHRLTVRTAGSHPVNRSSILRGVTKIFDMEKVDIDKTRVKQIEEVLKDNKCPQYTSKQIYDALYKRAVKSFEEITDISKALRQELIERVGEVSSLKKVKESKDEFSQKYLFELADRERIEAVVMKYKNHTSLCVSTQVGCAMGCKFCVTGSLGFKRNLTVDEMADQILYFKQHDIKVDTVFFSGMGEPFANPKFFEALEIIINPKYMGMGARNISVSTVGLIPGMRLLLEKYPQVNIAFSLHSPFAEERESIMPITKSYPISEVMNTLKIYAEKSKRKIFIVYLLLYSVNDSDQHAQALANIIKSMGKYSYLFHVNLMRYHKGDSRAQFTETPEYIVQKFQRILDVYKIKSTIRQDFGLELDAACGQLKANYRTRGLRVVSGSN
jgi:23S rRNA (adenine-C8)-methyltransferase